MPGAKGIILTLQSTGKTGNTPFFAIGVKLCLSVGKDLMHISLVAHIPNQNIARRIHEVMQNYTELCYSQTAAHVAWFCVGGFLNKVSQFPAELWELVRRNFPKISGIVDTIQNHLSKIARKADWGKRKGPLS